MNRAVKIVSVLIVAFFVSCNTENTSENIESNSVMGHPRLVLTKKGVEDIRNQLGTVPLFDNSLAETKREVDAAMAEGIDVPIPKDYSGGYTHQVHKKNWSTMQKAGLLFQILEDESYAIFVRDMLMEYAKLYPTFPKHPKTRSYARGKLFWQCLNDSNWLVYTSQAYDCIYEWLSEEERATLEKDLFIPFANYISEENPQFFNRVHNHSTWGNVAVGMIALVMDNEELLNRAMYGLPVDNADEGVKDNDGGFIREPGQEVGFLANLNEPFSPDGYYTEGPYYQRYAMYPFLIFAQALNNVKPELKIFEHKNGVLINAVDALVNLTDADGEFFAINDGQKGMSYHSKALVNAVDIAYHVGGNNPELLGIAKEQNKVVLNDAGMAVAKGIRDGKDVEFEKKTVNYSDGANGDEGGIGVVRSQGLELIFKYTAQGLSHGHYDKLSYFINYNGEEVLQDYGLSRFVNIGQKGGGNYLKENKTWAKETVAHNTLVRDEISHFKHKYAVASKNHSDLYFFEGANSTVQVVSAKELNAYPGTEIHRTMVMIKDDALINPFVLDVMRVTSEKKHNYDLPFYYLGQVIQTNFDYSLLIDLKPLGEKYGYQHLWKRGEGKAKSGNAKLGWLNDGVFYSLSTVTNSNDKLVFGQIGANDPEFNLRNDPVFMLRRSNVKNTVFASLVEPHGTYSPVSEFAFNSNSNIERLEVVLDTEDYTGVTYKLVTGETRVVVIANQSPAKDKEHKVNIKGKDINWIGPYYFN